MARGKLVEEPTTFDLEGSVSNPYYLRYMVGEIHADFVDQGETDLISTDRSSLAWGKEPASQLREWIQDEIKRINREHGEKEREAKVSEAKETESWDDRLDSLPEEKQEDVEEFVGEHGKHHDFNIGGEDEFIEKVAESAESEVFNDFISDIQKADVSDPGQVMDLFHRWEVLDALELMQVARGRLETISKFRLLLETDAKNNSVVHEFISENPWVLEPRWDYVDNEPQFSEQLSEEYPAEDFHDNPDTRLELFTLGYGESLNIIEILDPESTIQRRHLENLEIYVDYLRDQVQTDDNP
jgi:hypothetical protein